jgi:hypothetical protein
MNKRDVIEYIYSNYNKIIKSSTKITKNVQISEDCLSRVTIKILKLQDNYIIDYPIIYLNNAIRYEFINYKTTNKKYIPYITYPEIDDETYDPIQFKFLNLDILNKIAYKIQNILTKKERDVILSFLKGESFGDKNTFKCHYRNAIIKLQEAFVNGA